MIDVLALTYTNNRTINHTKDVPYRSLKTLKSANMAGKNSQIIPTNLGCIRRIRQLGGDVQVETAHDVTLLVADLDLVRTARLDEVLLKDVVQRGVKLFAHVFNQQRPPQRQSVLKVRTEVLVVQ